MDIKRENAKNNIIGDTLPKTQTPDDSMLFLRKTVVTAEPSAIPASTATYAITKIDREWRQEAFFLLHMLLLCRVGKISKKLEILNQQLSFDFLRLFEDNLKNEI